jgi:hypothetical protein
MSRTAVARIFFVGDIPHEGLAIVALVITLPELAVVRVRVVVPRLWHLVLPVIVPILPEKIGRR